MWLPNEESPGLAMSRAFGDYCIKEFGLISVPEVTHRSITSRDQFIILATDGVRIRASLALQPNELTCHSSVFMMLKRHPEDVENIDLELCVCD